MKRLKRSALILVVLILFIFSYKRVLAQAGSTSKGTEFWTCWMDHVNGAVASPSTPNVSPSKMSLYITSDVSTSGTVDIADKSATIPFNVTANQVTIVDIPASAYLATQGSFLKGIHIIAAKPIAVYAHIYAMSVSGATLLLPVNTLGKSYFSLNYTQLSNEANSYSVFDVVATEDATTVEITPAAKLLDGKPANAAFTITLSKGQVYQGLSTTDLTGTKIRSISAAGQPCKKIAVFSGSGKIRIGCATGSVTSDNLFQQVYPTASWGKNYITAPLKDRHYDTYRVILSDPATKVTVNGVAVAQFINNLYYEFNSDVTNVITADKPIQVVQYAVTQRKTLNCIDDNQDIGDPEMIFLTPIEQSIDQVTLYSTSQYLITKNFINVIIPHSASASFTIDGTKTGVNFVPVPGNALYDYAQISVNSGTHNIKANEGFNAIAYGFGLAESYGYSAGTNLKNLNQFIELKDISNNTTSASGCINLSYQPQISIPYQTTNISWDFKDNKPPVVINNPTPTGTVQKGDVLLYIYQYPSTIKYTASGSYTIVATVLNPTADDCGSNEDIQFDYSISDIPNAKFSTSVTSKGACPGNEVAFTDETATNGIATKTWSWDFGDAANATPANPNTATNQNPKHIYTKPGDYTISLTVENQNGCSTTATQTIHVNIAPVSAFSISTPDCETRDVTFDPAASTPGEGTLNKWVWDFGDSSTPVINSTSAPVTHQFAKAGTYHVSLTVTSSTDCVSDIKTTDVIIHDLPKVDFVLPDVCLSDAFAQFTNKTTIADGSDAQLTYAWDFGDGNSTPANPNTSTLANPKHKYTKVGTYTVTLKVTSNNGCVVTLQQQFTVNGDTPNAAFTVNNLGNTYCSSEDVLFKDNSTVNFGNVTKLVWYFDYTNNPTQTTVYTKDAFPADGIFRHNYGLFSDQPSKNYAVKLEAYSGGTCVSVTGITNITVFANPLVSVTPVAPLCQETPPVQIQSKVLYGDGTGVFSGPGVTPSGLFDPAKSGPGTFTINYVFTTTATGCTYGTSQQITVYPTPTADAGTDLHVLQGGNITINATADGVKPLTYKWTLANGNPATWLNHDDVLSPVASPLDDVTYMLTVTSADGCTKSSTVSIQALKQPVVPNTFTPNNDGFNDYWEIKYLDTYPNCSVDIYNRYGEKLYSSVNYSIPWDGTYKGAALPVGTYYYIINPKNGRKVITGSVTIIR